MTELLRAHAETEHLSGRSREERRDLGQVYTPEWLVRFVLAQALDNLGGSNPRTLDGPVLDPSCGAGAFLVGVVEQLAAEWASAGKTTSGSAAATFVATVAETVFGLDVDASAVDIARDEVSAAVVRITGVDLDRGYFDRNIRVGDFLWEPLRGFDFPIPRLIVGNPPYVPADRIAAGDKRRFREAFSTAFGRLDLYTLFMERAARLVGEGAFAFITPDKYLLSQSARPLRELLVSLGAVESISVFDSHKVFLNAATVPCVTVWRGAAADTGCTDHVVRFDRVSLGSGAVSQELEERRIFSGAHLKAATWSFQRSRHESLEERLVAGKSRLGERTARVSAGITTGHNAAFVLNGDIAATLEPELIHPTVGGRDIIANHVMFRDQYMLVPYVWVDQTPRLVDLDDYPRAREWLTQHRGRLEQRHCVRVWGKKWWDLHDPVGLPLHQAEKVLVPDLARSNRFAADEGLYVPQHSVYYLIGGDLPADVLAALLNSPAVEFLVRSTAPRVKDGFSRYRSQFLETLPIPDIDQNTQHQIRQALTDGRDDDLSDITAGLFGVDRDEVERAVAALAPSRSRSSSGPPRARRVSPSGEAPPI